MTGEELDRKFNECVDEWCVRIPRRFRIIKVHLASLAFFWHLSLFFSSFFLFASGLLVHFRSDEDMDMLLSDTADRLNKTADRFRRFFMNIYAWFLAIDENSISLSFKTLLFYSFLSVCGVVFSPGVEMNYCCLGVILFMIAGAFESHFTLFTGIFRQEYIIMMFARAAGCAAFMTGFYTLYSATVVRTNAILQFAMVFMIGAHLVIFFIMVAFNKRQPLFLRLLSGILNVFPALMVAAAVACSMPVMFAGPVSFILGALRIIGVLLLFCSVWLETLKSLGALRFSNSGLFYWLFIFLGVFMLVGIAWIF